MGQLRFSVRTLDPELSMLMVKAEPRILVAWSRDCAKHVMNYYLEKDEHPNQALFMCSNWLEGKISDIEAKAFAFTVHACARKMKDKSSCEVARSCGHALAATNAVTYSIYAANYAVSAIYHTKSSDKIKKMKREREWQRSHLAELLNR